MLSDDGYRVTVVSPALHGYTKPYERLDGIDILRHPMPAASGTPQGYVIEYSTALWHEWRLMQQVWKKEPFDVLQICNPPDVLFLLGLWARVVFRVPVIYDHHDLSPELYAAKFGKRGWMFRVLRGLERLTYATADVVLATNESYRQLALGKGSKRAEDVFVVRNAPLSVNPACPPSQDAALRHGRRYLAAFVGWMAEQDGVDYFVDAVEHVVHVCGRADVQFLAIGDGPVRMRWMEEAQLRGLDDFIIWPGFVEGARLQEMISAVDVYLCPEPKNAFNDVSTMIKVVEAMAYGKPVVQFDLVEGRRTAGEAALYADANSAAALGDKLLELLDDENLRAALGSAARRRFDEALSWDVQKGSLLAAYARARSKR